MAKGGKWKCKECHWVGTEYLEAPNPFDPEYHIVGCPQCKEAETLVPACSEPNCCREATIGMNTKDGYRWICHEHRPYE